MANWAAFQQELVGLPVYKRERYSIHFKRPDGLIQGDFVGAPCHFQDTDGLWKPLDTKLIAASGGFYGAPGLDSLIHPDGRVQLGTYQQYTPLPGTPIGLVDNDRIVREFSGGRQYIWLKEGGIHEEIILDSLPPLSGARASAYISQVTGTLPSKYTYYGTRCIDATGKEFVFTGNMTAFREWMNAAAYPVTIDPDYLDSTADDSVYGYSATYTTAHGTAEADYSGSTTIRIGQQLAGGYYEIDRAGLKFDTSGIGATGNVNQVNLKATHTAGVQTNVEVQIVKQNWSAQDPITVGNMDTFFDNCLSGTADDSIWANTNDVTRYVQKASGNLNTAWVNKTGYTYYSMRTANDLAGTPPTGNEYATLGAQENGTVGYRPVLTVLWSAPSGGQFILFT